MGFRIFQRMCVSMLIMMVCLQASVYGQTYRHGLAPGSEVSVLDGIQGQKTIRSLQSELDVVDRQLAALKLDVCDLSIPVRFAAGAFKYRGMRASCFAFDTKGQVLYLATVDNNCILAIDSTTGYLDKTRFSCGVFNAPDVIRNIESLIIHGRTLYAISKDRLVAIDLFTGCLDRSLLQEGVYQPEHPGDRMGVATLDASRGILYTAERIKGSGVLAIDLERGKLASSIFQNGRLAGDMVKHVSALHLAGDTLYIACCGSNRIAAVDLKTGTLDTAKFDQGVFHNPAILAAPSAFYQVGQTLYVAGFASNSIVALDVESGTLDRTRLGKGIYQEQGNARCVRGPVALAHHRNTLFVVGLRSSSIVAIDMKTGRLDTCHYDQPHKSCKRDKFPFFIDTRTGLAGTIGFYGGVFRHLPMANKPRVLIVDPARETLYVGGQDLHCVVGLDLGRARPQTWPYAKIAQARSCYREKLCLLRGEVQDRLQSLQERREALMVEIGDLEALVSSTRLEALQKCLVGRTCGLDQKRNVLALIGELLEKDQKYPDLAQVLYATLKTFAQRIHGEDYEEDLFSQKKEGPAVEKDKALKLYGQLLDVSQDHLDLVELMFWACNMMVMRETGASK